MDDLINEGHEDFLGSGNDFIPSTSNQRERPIPIRIQENEERIRNDEVINVRRFLHRENERQRRQEMGNLCGSLRTLLPPEYVKGKRSLPDQLQGAVNYIKDMQNNIHQLKARRDNLKKSANYFDSHQIDNLPNCVTVNPCPNRVEILISTIFEEKQGFSLSRILRELHDRGFDAVSCFSTKADNEGSLHRIELEASNPPSEDLAVLQERLEYMINFPR
ncbi:hypothetical protein CDL12_16074 [Handroanthus impetiginosus]|uniref:BHLH domain-containing protein n=1 Tax=Handroanthus impetiginosus TaxID=429701 RepID=A0A2G9H1D3_9LAMI|nr:hypothetical protein CDL12_16074 [Handroanthus impetiginosus]